MHSTCRNKILTMIEIIIKFVVSHLRLKTYVLILLPNDFNISTC